MDTMVTESCTTGFLLPRLACNDDAVWFEREQRSVFGGRGRSSPRPTSSPAPATTWPVTWAACRSSCCATSRASCAASRTCADTAGW